MNKTHMSEVNNYFNTSGSGLKCITISLSELMLALPVEKVDKVIKQTPVISSGLNHMGITHYEGDPITVVDLHYQLFQRRQSEKSSGKYLIIAKAVGQNKFAFPVQEAPSLVEFPMSSLRVLPPSYRGTDTLEVASHVVRKAHSSGDETTFFVLDVDYLSKKYGENKVTAACTNLATETHMAQIR